MIFRTNISTASLASMVKALGINQEDISKATGISQSQISRILSGSGKRQTKSFHAICNYVFSLKSGISPERVRQNDVLINALCNVWDGSAQQANVLAGIIQSLGGLCALQKNR